jgi:hypothetical protein
MPANHCYVSCLRKYNFRISTTLLILIQGERINYVAFAVD